MSPANQNYARSIDPDDTPKTDTRKTRDLLLTKQQMGHRKIETTLIYTQLINNGSEEFYSATAKTVEEATKLIEQGFDYICDVDGIKLFRKRK